jgi:hypothetical protein
MIQHSPGLNGKSDAQFSIALMFRARQPPNHSVKAEDLPPLGLRQAKRLVRVLLSWVYRKVVRKQKQ